MIVINEETTRRELMNIVANSDKVCVLIGADWCGLCKVFLPTFKRLAKENENIKFVYLTAELNVSLTFTKADYFPMLLTFAKGNRLEKSTKTDRKLLTEQIETLIKWQ